VVSLTQVREVAGVRRAAERVIDRVIDLAADGGEPAAGKAAVLVACAQVPVDRGGPLIGVDASDIARPRSGVENGRIRLCPALSAIPRRLAVWGQNTMRRQR
jgi:hypothetical protein